MGATFDPQALPQPRIASDAPPGAIVYATARGSNVFDVDGNRYVDLAAGFGALLLGHGHRAITRAVELQLERLTLALGDVFPSDAKVALLERLAGLFPEPGARAIVGQSGSDAVTVALKTAALATGKPGVLAFEGAYHGLGYGPLAACAFRESYRAPFASQLNPRVTFAPYPADQASLDRALSSVRGALQSGDVGAVLVEPILGRGGCIVPPDGFLRDVGVLARDVGALVIADEIWTGLGRSGQMLCCPSAGLVPDLVCLGKGLGGGLPISACVGRGDVMLAWRQAAEVVHTSTFAGAPMACTAALATLDVLSRERLPDRARALGESAQRRLVQELVDAGRAVAVRGRGLMLGIDLGDRPAAAAKVQRAMLERGFLVTTGGTERSVVVLTPPLNIGEDQFDAALAALGPAIDEANA